MIAYKLFRRLKSGDITSLFINKKERLQLNKWMQAKSYPTKGFAVRPHWHCTAIPEAPHLSMKNRQWYKVEMQDFSEFQRPQNQGGKWYLANQIRIIEAV